MTKLHGTEAVDYAERTGAELHKYNDPTEPARDGLSVEEARQICQEDGSLIWCDADDETE